MSNLTDDLLSTTYDDDEEEKTDSFEELRKQMFIREKGMTDGEARKTLKQEIEKCSLNCVDGEIFSFAQKKMIPCPECAKKREQLVRRECVNAMTGNKTVILDALRINKKYLNTQFDFNSIIPKYCRDIMRKDSLLKLEEVINNLFGDMLDKKKLDHSMMFNFGSVAEVNNFTSPVLLRAFQNGYKVVPVVSAAALRDLRVESNLKKDSSKQKWGMAYNHYLEADICIMRITCGATPIERHLLKGLMQDRADMEKATIIVTQDFERDTIRNFIDWDTNGQKKSYSTATLYSIEYLPKEEISRIDMTSEAGKRCNRIFYWGADPYTTRKYIDYDEDADMARSDNSYEYAYKSKSKQSNEKPYYERPEQPLNYGASGQFSGIRHVKPEENPVRGYYKESDFGVI